MMDKKGKTTIDINGNDDKNDNKDKEDKDNKNILSQISRETHHKKIHKSNKISDISNLEKIKLQNEKINIILKNIELKQELKKALKNNKLDKKEIEILRDIFKKK